MVVIKRNNGKFFIDNREIESIDSASLRRSHRIALTNSDQSSVNSHRFNFIGNRSPLLSYQYITRNGRPKTIYGVIFANSGGRITVIDNPKIGAATRIQSHTRGMLTRGRPLQNRLPGLNREVNRLLEHTELKNLPSNVKRNIGKLYAEKVVL